MQNPGQRKGGDWFTRGGVTELSGAPVEQHRAGGRAVGLVQTEEEVRTQAKHVRGEAER